MTTEATAISDKLEIAGSPAKLLLMAAGGTAFVALGVWLLTLEPQTARNTFAGYASIIFFGAITCLILFRLVNQRGPVITLTPQGFHDVRVTNAPVPWQAVDAVSVWESHGQPAVIVKLKPAAEASVDLTTIARLTRRANAALGADGLALTAQGTRTSHDELLKAIINYCERYT